MPKTRVGVVADTHCPEFLEALPESVLDSLRGVDLILHAGDVDGASTLEALGRIAPVHAVRGDHDRALDSVPEVRRLTVGGLRFVVVHGQRSRWIEEPQTLLWTLSLGLYHPHKKLPALLRRRFPEADVIVFGHTHRPYARTVDGVLLFNPGGVHQWNPTTATRRLRQSPGWFEWCWLQFARHFRRYQKPSVGLIEVDEAGAVPAIIGL